MRTNAFIAKGLCLCLIIASSRGLHGAEVAKIKMAVLDFRTVGEATELGEGAAEILRTTLMETGKYTVIERGMLKQVLQEQKLSLSGAIDQNEAVGIGKLLGAKLVAVGSVVKLGESYTLNIRFVDVETGEVISGKKLTARSKEEIPALCTQMVKLLAGGKASAPKEEPVSLIPDEIHVEQKTTSKTFSKSKLAVGLVYPGAAIKYATGGHAWELKAQSGLNILAVGPRYYKYLSKSGVQLFWGLEGDYITFKGKESKGTGFAGGIFAGGEIPLSDQLGLSMDFGPMYINLAETEYDQTASGVEYVLNFGVYWYFR